MKALVKSRSEPGLWLEEVEIPTIQSHEVLIKIRSNAICGTDLHIFHWDTWAKKTVPVPLIIGHEFMGEIVQIGKEVTHLQIGQRVSGEGHITCGNCRNCREGKQYLCPYTQGIGSHRNGAFAEYLALPASNVIVIPETISDDIATILDPLGNAVHASLCFDLIGENVLITGAGPIGLMTSAIAKHIGAKTILITDINDYRLNLASILGATHIVNVSDQSLKEVLKKLNLNLDMTVGLEMSGHPSNYPLLLESLCYGGNITLMGIPTNDVTIDMNKIIFKGLTLKGIYGRKMFETWDKMLSLLQSGLDVSAVITHHFNIQDYQKAFQTAELGQAGKVLLHW